MAYKKLAVRHFKLHLLPSAMGENLIIMVYLFDEVGSTNDLARDPKYVHGDVIMARCQTSGRGQRGNSWSSRGGQNLTFSLVVEPDFLPAGCQFMLLEAVALGLTDALMNYSIGARIKWTNDIYVGDRKIAGVLIENDICGENLSRSIIGIGLNVNQTDFDPSLPNPTSMRLQTGMEYEIEGVLGSVYEAIGMRLEQLEQAWSESQTDERHSSLYAESDIKSPCVDQEFTPTPSFHALYNSLLYKSGEPQLFALPDCTRKIGIIQNVSTTGELFIKWDDSTVKGYLFKEIEFVI